MPGLRRGPCVWARARVWVGVNWGAHGWWQAAGGHSAWGRRMLELRRGPCVWGGGGAGGEEGEAGSAVLARDR